MSNEEKIKKDKQIDGDDNELEFFIKSEEVAGSYTNYMKVNHNSSEFLVDFFMMQPSQAFNVAKLIINPIYIKNFVKTLQNNIKKYEDRYGIELPEEPNDFIEEGLKKTKKD